MGSEDLIPNSERTPEELKEMTTKGGIASGKARREQSKLKKQINAMFDIMEQRQKATTKDEAIIKDIEAMGGPVYQMFQMIGNKKMKSETKVKIMLELMDRVYGKPQQAIDHSGAIATASVELTKEQVKESLEKITNDIG